MSACTVTAPSEPAAATTFRVISWNIHHGRGLDGQVDLDRIAAVIREQGADLVALQEVDKGVARTAGRDLAAELAKLTSMTPVFSNNFHFQGGEYGNAILSRFPVIQSTNLHYTMVRPGEQRGLLQVTVQVDGRELMFLNTHIDYRGDDAERWANVEEIEAVVAQHPGSAIILAGDFNDHSGSRVIARLGRTFEDAWGGAGEGDGATYPAGAPRSRIDYVWFSPSRGLRATRAWVPVTDASDHRPVVVAFEWR
jgi:endonuclease/exonuclease/phosphatase family metal-dependent hydrolase